MLNRNVKDFGVIFKTKDYNMFSHINSNRKLNSVNYGKLLRSMKEEQLIIPICVNEKYEVIDGQHRLKVCEELNLPVYFYVLEGYTLSQMKRANLVSANWKKDDFLNAYVNEGQKDYIDFAEMKERYGLNTSDLIKIIAKIKCVAATTIGINFEEGGLRISEEDKGKITGFLVSLQDFSFFKEYKTSKFVSAFLELYFFQGYKHEQMQTRLKTRSEVISPQITKDEYIKLLTNKVYSFGTSKNNIYYDADRKKIYALD